MNKYIKLSTDSNGTEDKVQCSDGAAENLEPSNLIDVMSTVLDHLMDIKNNQQERRDSKYNMSQSAVKKDTNRNRSVSFSKPSLALWFTLIP